MERTVKGEEIERGYSSMRGGEWKGVRGQSWPILKTKEVSVKTRGHKIWR